MRRRKRKKEKRAAVKNEASVEMPTLKAEVRKTWLRSIENKNKRNEGTTGDCEREERLGNN